MTKWIRATYDIECTGLDHRNGDIISVAALKTSKEGVRKGRILTVRDWVTVPETGKKYPTKKEQIRLVRQLAEFLSDIDKNSKIISYNGDTYDWYFLTAVAGLADDYGDLVDKIFCLKEQHGHDLFKTHGKTRDNWYSLEELLEKHGLEHESDVCGEIIADLFQKGEIEKIKSYLKEDVRKTDKLASKFIDSD